MAGMAGFEPTNTRVKVWCLTTWQHPNITTTPPKAVSQRQTLFLKLGWIMGLEPTTPRATIWCSNHLSYTHHIKVKMARLRRLELMAYCLEGSCSIQLSYRRE